MRIRHAATSLVALGAASACAIGAGVIHHAGVQREAAESALRSSTWSVQASTDFGTTWTAPVSSSGGRFPVIVDTAGLRSRAAYQPLTLRTTTGSLDPAHVSVSAGELIEGDPTTASEVRVRAVSSEQGTCAAPTFTARATPLLRGGGTSPQPVDSPTTADPLVLPGATRTTAGAPVTVCLELSISPDAPVADSVLTLAWPIQVARIAGDA